LDRQGSLRECSDGMRTALNLRCMLARSRALMLMLLTAWRPDSPLSRAVRAHMSQDAPRSSTTRGGVSSSTRRARSAPPSPPHSLFAACTGRAPPSMHRLVVPARALLGMGCPDGSRAREQHVGTELPHWQTRAQTPDGSARVWRRSVVLCACVPFRSLSLSAVFSGVSTRGFQSVADSLGVRWTWPGIRVRIVQGSCGQWAEHAARAASHACLARFGSGTGEAHLHAGSVRADCGSARAWERPARWSVALRVRTQRAMAGPVAMVRRRDRLAWVSRALFRAQGATACVTKLARSREVVVSRGCTIGNRVRASVYGRIFPLIFLISHSLRRYLIVLD